MMTSDVHITPRVNWRAEDVILEPGVEKLPEPKMIMHKEDTFAMLTGAASTTGCPVRFRSVRKKSLAQIG